MASPACRSPSRSTGSARTPNGGQRVGFSATAQINRADFGIDRWTGGGAVVGDEVPIRLRIEAALQ